MHVVSSDGKTLASGEALESHQRPLHALAACVRNIPSFWRQWLFFLSLLNSPLPDSKISCGVLNHEMINSWGINLTFSFSSFFFP